MLNLNPYLSIVTKMKQNNQILKYSNNDQKSAPEIIENIIDEQMNLICKNGCKLCNSDHRSEAEDLWEKNQNMNAVHRFIESKGEKVSYPAIRRHLISHYKKKESLDKRAEYIKDLKVWRANRIEKEERLDLLMSILEKRIVELAAEQDGNTDDPGRRMAETMVKLIQQLLSCQQAADEYKQLLEPVKLIIERLQNIVKEEVQTSSGNDVRKALMNVVSSLEKDVHEIMKNGK